jgi:hypothetical protein
VFNGFLFLLKTMFCTVYRVEFEYGMRMGKLLEIV